MSGPVEALDIEPKDEDGELSRATVEISASRTTQVGAFAVRRALPRRQRRTVGAWCFLDHLGPMSVDRNLGIDIGPHPHMGLQTVTWLLAGEVIHRDSLGTEQLIRPGELNLMTAGHGVAHSEERTGCYEGEMHGVQLWVAQPSVTRDGAAAFEHFVELPKIDFRGAIATVLVGEFDGVTSPARRDTDHVGIDLVQYGRGTTLPLRPECEYALVVFDGEVVVDGELITPGHLAYLGLGRDECHLSTSARARAFLFGGIPFEESILMWWNFVARTQSEIVDAYQDWTIDTARFGHVESALARIGADPPLWSYR